MIRNKLKNLKKKEKKMWLTLEPWFTLEMYHRLTIADTDFKILNSSLLKPQKGLFRRKSEDKLEEQTNLPYEYLKP